MHGFVLISPGDGNLSGSVASLRSDVAHRPVEI